ncbi:hypothetical protein ABZ119_09215 [Streptomyces sp. NPDC006288]|uniref:hypothetical protein n=1 Tax=Streptomyces sp. NPDC006288 TaxID=3156743 RepID=UPI0033B255AA
MSYPDQGGSDFEIYTAPTPPQTARQLVEEMGLEAVREAMPSAERRAFDQANPWRSIERANERLQERDGELNAFDQDLRNHIAERGYTPEQAQVVRDQTANIRQPLEAALIRSQQRARDALGTYQENLITHIDNRRLVGTVAARTGQYSAPLNTPTAAALQPSAGGRNNRHDGGGGRGPLGESRGSNRRPANRR